MTGSALLQQALRGRVQRASAPPQQQHAGHRTGAPPRAACQACGRAPAAPRLQAATTEAPAKAPEASLRQQQGSGPRLSPEECTAIYRPALGPALCSAMAMPMLAVRSLQCGRAPRSQASLIRQRLAQLMSAAGRRDMYLGREFEEMCAQMYYRGKMFGFVHLYSGQEVGAAPQSPGQPSYSLRAPAAAADSTTCLQAGCTRTLAAADHPPGAQAVSTGVIGALRKDDFVCSTYRDHVHALSKGVPSREIMAELFGKKTGICRGQGGSMHMFSKEHGLVRPPCSAWRGQRGDLAVALEQPGVHNLGRTQRATPDHDAAKFAAATAGSRLRWWQACTGHASPGPGQQPAHDRRVQRLTASCDRSWAALPSSGRASRWAWAPPTASSMPRWRPCFRTLHACAQLACAVLRWPAARHNVSVLDTSSNTPARISYRRRLTHPDSVPCGLADLHAHSSITWLARQLRVQPCLQPG